MVDLAAHHQIHRGQGDLCRLLQLCRLLCCHMHPLCLRLDHAVLLVHLQRLLSSGGPCRMGLMVC